MMSRISCSTSANRSSVSSIRVPAGRPHVKTQRARVHVGEEILSDHRHQQERAQRHHHEPDQDGRPPPQRQMQQTHVAIAKALEQPVHAAVEGPENPPSSVPARLVHGHLAPKQVMHHRRHQGSRQQVRRHHREDHRHRQRCEEILRGSSQQEHGYEHDADGQRGHERGHGDLRGPVQHGANERLPHGEVPMRVFNLDRRIVHENADGQRQSSERHHVDGLAQQAEDADRRQDRQRNRKTHDQRAAPASQEQQDDQAGQQRGDQRLPKHAPDRGPHEERLIAEDGQLQILRHGRHDPGQGVLDRVDHGERGRPAVACDRQQHAAGAVRANDVGLGNEPVVDGGDVFHVDRRAVDCLDREVVELLDARQAAVQAHGILGTGELRRSRRDDQILEVQ